MQVSTGSDVYEAKLSSSGLTLADAALLGMQRWTRDDASKFIGRAAPSEALWLPYHGIDGAPVVDRPGDPPYGRLRWLAPPASFKKHEDRYWQPPLTRPHCYFPRSVDWFSAFAHGDSRIVITEGELKAACASKVGIPTIGLGGVNSWRAWKQGIRLLPELVDLPWSRQHVCLIFDSDLISNQNVMRAMTGLAEALSDLGADVYGTWVPAGESSGKVGLDDYLVVNGMDPTSMEPVFARAQPMSLSRELYELNDRFVYASSPGLVLDLSVEPPQLHKPGDVASHLASNKLVVVQVGVTADGDPKLDQVSAGDAWLKWPQRHAVDRLTYAPGKPIEFDRQRNLWTGWGCAPARGDVSPFISLVDHLFSGADQASKRWFLDWLAYPLQYPGTKLYTSVLVHGLRTGTGKSLLGYTMAKIYGNNFTEISESMLRSPFNEWARYKQFVLADDVIASRNREDQDLLKKLITQLTIRINEKFVPSYVVPDCLNYYFTSNHPDALFLEDDDRRMFVHEVQVGPLGEDFYKEYDLWVSSSTGPAALFDWMLRRDVSGFNPQARAQSTQAKVRMTQDSQSDLGTWVRQLVSDPEPILRAAKVPIHQDLFTSTELFGLYAPQGNQRVTPNGLARELRRAGAALVNGGKSYRWHGGQGRLYVIRHQAAWSGAVPDARVKQHEQLPHGAGTF